MAKIARALPQKVLERGLEPPRPCGHKNLNLARLPIPPLEQRVFCIYRLRPAVVQDVAMAAKVRGGNGLRCWAPSPPTTTGTGFDGDRVPPAGGTCVLIGNCDTSVRERRFDRWYVPVDN